MSWTKQQVAEHMDKMFNDLQALREAGQKEYAHKDENAFSNFESLGRELNLPREKVLWVYAKKHIDGIISHINGHRSQREPVHGRVKDLIVYMVLLDAMLTEDEVELTQKVSLGSDLCLNLHPVDTVGGKLTHQCTKGKGHSGNHGNRVLEWN